MGRAVVMGDGPVHVSWRTSGRAALAAVRGQVDARAELHALGGAVDPPAGLAEAAARPGVALAAAARVSRASIGQARIVAGHADLADAVASATMPLAHAAIVARLRRDHPDIARRADAAVRYLAYTPRIRSLTCLLGHARERERAHNGPMKGSGDSG
jgi:hypothetical protein